MTKLKGVYHMHYISTILDPLFNGWVENKFYSSATNTCIYFYKKYEISATNIKRSMWYHD